MTMPGRNANPGDYRYGFNTQEALDEVSSTNNHYTAQYWEYNPRVVHRWNVDPILKESESAYLVNHGNPIWYNDPNGADGKKRAYRYAKENGGEVSKVGNEYHVYTSRLYENEFGITEYEVSLNVFKDNGIERFFKAIGRLERGVNESMQSNVAMEKADQWARTNLESPAQIIAETNPLVATANIALATETGKDIFGYEYSGTDYVFAAIGIIPGGSTLKHLKLATKYSRLFRVSKVASDWITKGAHVHLDGIELALRPGTDGSIIIQSVFSTQNIHAVQRATEKLKIAMHDPNFRRELIEKSKAARDMFKNGTEAERAVSGELNFLITALEKL